MTTSTVAPIAVIGIGTPVRHDDGVGPAMIDLLEDHDLGPHVELISLDGEATRLIEAWRDRELALVVDTVIGGAKPGTQHRAEVGVDALPDWATTPSSHAAGLAEAIALGAVVDRLPRKLVVLGIEPADISLGYGLSSAVSASLPDLVEAVHRELTAIGR